jgi:subtilase family protein
MAMPHLERRSFSFLIVLFSVFACLVAALPAKSAVHSAEAVPPRDLPEYPTPALWDLLLEGTRPGEPGAGAIIGLKSNFPRGVWKDRILVTGEERARSLAGLRKIAGLRVDWEDPVLPRVFAWLANQETLEAIRALPGIDYVAPLRGRLALASQTSGCGFGPYFGPPAKDTFHANQETISLFGPFADFVPWSFVDLFARAGSLPFNPAIRGHRIPEAWRRAGGGNGVLLVVTDTGVKGAQREVIDTDRDGSRFATGASLGRTMTELDAFTGTGDQLEDLCGHGTLSATTALAPMNDQGIGETLVGVAWAANGTSVRIGDDVWLDGADYDRAVLGIRRGVCGGTTSCSTAPNPRTVISMAWGDINLNNSLSWPLNDEINFWFSQGTVLFLAAAGTGRPPCLGGLSGNTIYPAILPNVVAVSCVDPRTGGLSGGVCNTKDVSGVWGQPSGSGLTGDVPAGGETDDTGSNTAIAHFGGSSACVSTVSGIAALAWSKRPDFNNVAVRQRLNESGHLFPTKHPEMGFGVVDAFRAVGGLGPVFASAPFKAIKGTNYTVQSAVAFGDGPLRFEWTDGSCFCRYNVSTGACSNPACPLVGTCTIAGQSHPRCKSISVPAPATAGQRRQIHLAVFDEGSLDQSDLIAMKDSLAVTCAAEPNTCGSRTCGTVSDGCGGTYSCGGSCGLHEYCSSFGQCACSAPYHRCGENGPCTKDPCWEP